MTWTKSAKQLLQVLLVTGFLFVIGDLVYSTGIISQQAVVNRFGESGIVRTRHPVYHHDLQPNLNVITRWGDQEYRLCTDQYGFRSACDRGSQNTQGKHFDIGFIGDSFTEASGIEFENSFVGLFASAHPELRVANLGVLSYSPSIYLKKIEYLLSNSFTFDHIVIFLDISDIQDEGDRYRIENGRVIDKAEVDHKKNDQQSFLGKGVRYLRERFGRYFRWTFYGYDCVASYYAQLSFSMGKRQLKSGETDRLRSLADYYAERSHWTYTPASQNYGEGGVNGAIEQALDSMLKLKALLDRCNIKMSVGVYPWEAQLRNDKKDHRGVTIWRDFCARVDCSSFIDANEVFFDEMNKTDVETVLKKYYIAGDVHFNNAGNEVLFNALQNQLLLR